VIVAAKEAEAYLDLVFFLLTIDVIVAEKEAEAYLLLFVNPNVPETVRLFLGYESKRATEARHRMVLYDDFALETGFLALGMASHLECFEQRRAGRVDSTMQPGAVREKLRAADSPRSVPDLGGMNRYLNWLLIVRFLLDQHASQLLHLLRLCLGRLLTLTLGLNLELRLQLEGCPVNLYWTERAQKAAA
jgi:hypothetical protein